ncbi:hypothetical protein GCM10011581_41060 [Saccharopolyspora subtropica]|uniref:DUF6802 domain-containing protein n=1 Tax=Saccharopolyspora thermophila TaxID=89367 RepID=A0A917NGN1_9PSEU|nr:DUF6802 family protein [Saccharopolyspora subtropica]GGI99702.1 hypothetical protein GCM10011581_41060 [Saccharopolyspora subtropica]
MYIEETGAGDGDIKVTVDGEEYTAEANYDLDGDGVDETVTVMTDDGFVAYIDENADGQADVMQTVVDGTVVEQARYDASTGQWTGETPEQHPDGGGQDHGQQMVIDTPQGDVQVGPATEDTNQDGVADTAVVETESGSTMLVTDVDGDGSADQLVEITQTGDVTISRHTGDGEWTVVEQGTMDQDGQYTPNPASGATDDAAWTFDEAAQPHAAGVGVGDHGHDRAAEGSVGGHRGGGAAGRPDSDDVWG